MTTRQSLEIIQDTAKEALAAYDRRNGVEFIKQVVRINDMLVIVLQMENIDPSNPSGPPTTIIRTLDS